MSVSPIASHVSPIRPSGRTHAQDGVRFNSGRGIGLVFGPDATDYFLRTNGLRLIIRSHEGPDARAKRPDMNSMDSGWCAVCGHGTASSTRLTRSPVESRLTTLAMRKQCHPPPTPRARCVVPHRSVDHASEHGCLATLFSAPCYPQFCPRGTTRVGNQAAVRAGRGALAPFASERIAPLSISHRALSAHAHQRRETRADRNLSSAACHVLALYLPNLT